MIKRRFYRLEHGDKDEASSDSSSSSSDSDVEAEASDNSVDNASAEDGDHQDDTCSTSSGYESEESSASEINEDTLGSADEADPSEDDNQTSSSPKLSGKPLGRRTTDSIAEDESEPIDNIPDCVLQVKSVYRCKICPRIICLTDETMRVHLKSKRHARSEKQLKENRLKTALNSDGEMENQETPAEMNARIVALAAEKTKRKNRGRQRQRNRLRKKKTADDPVVEEKKKKKKTKESTEGLARKRRKK